MYSGNHLADQIEKEWDERHSEGKCNACGSNRLEEIQFCDEYCDECDLENCDLPKDICPGSKVAWRCLDCDFISRY